MAAIAGAHAPGRTAAVTGARARCVAGLIVIGEGQRHRRAAAHGRRHAEKLEKKSPACAGAARRQAPAQRKRLRPCPISCAWRPPESSALSTREAVECSWPDGPRAAASRPDAAVGQPDRGPARGAFFGSTTTLVPTSTRLNRSLTSSLVRRMHPTRRTCRWWWIVGAVDAVFAGAEIHRARAERIARTAGDEARQIRLARDHLGRRHTSRAIPSCW